MAKVAVCGHGTVGSGVAEILYNQQALMEKRIGEPLTLGYVLDVKEVPDVPYKNCFTKDFNDILKDPEVVVVAEAIGGINPAYTFLKESLQAGKHAVTANKELIAEKGAELLKIAKENNVNLMFEASVGGGIPIIRPLHQCLAGNNITSIAGILNGTSNFILTKMFGEGAAFADVLKEAQELGYAEADPSADVDGIDTGRKICILSSLAFGKHVYPKDITMKGIREITSSQVELADTLGYVIRLVGFARPNNGKVEAFVAPMLIDADTMLGTVKDVYNAVEFCGDAVGDVLLYGQGAGKLPTASAMVGDIVDCVRRGDTVESQLWEDGNGEHVIPFEDVVLSRLVEYQGEDEAVTEVFGELDVIVEINGTVAFFTPELPQKELEDKLEQLNQKGGRVVSSVLVLKR